MGFKRRRQEEELEAVSKVGREVGRELEAARQAEKPPSAQAPLEERLAWDLLRAEGPSRRFEAKARATLDKLLKRADY